MAMDVTIAANKPPMILSARLSRRWIFSGVRPVMKSWGISNEEFASLNKSLHRLERFWTDQILYRL